MSLCCLCRDPVPLDHRRRKRFHGESCSKARSMIKSLSDKCYAELSDPCALLCQGCEKKLINISVRSLYVHLVLFQRGGIKNPSAALPGKLVLRGAARTRPPCVTSTHHVRTLVSSRHVFTIDTYESLSTLCTVRPQLTVQHELLMRS